MTAAHTEPVISSDGTRLFVVEEGDGDTVLFIPGLGYGTWSWHHQVGPISDVARVLLMDNRGVGLSDRPLGPYSIEQMAQTPFPCLRSELLPPHMSSGHRWAATSR
jgi:pimeloyl-ACP methyl ester carboxylesterase